MAARKVTPPAGFVLDNSGGGSSPAPPPGFVLEDHQPAASGEKSQSPEASISAAPPSGIMHPINWLNDAESDVRHGGEKTWLGRGFKAIGGQPLENGTNEATANFVAGVPLGASRLTRGLLGAAESPYTKTDYEKAHPIKTGVRTANNIIGGAGQMLAEPLAVLQPETMAKAALPIAAGAGAQQTAKYFGADPDTQEFAGNLTGLATGGIQEGAPKLVNAIREGAPNAAAKIGAFGKVLGKEAVSKVPFAGRVVQRPSFSDYIEAARAKAPSRVSGAPDPDAVYSPQDEMVERVTGGGMQLPKAEDVPHPEYESPWGGNTSATGTISRTRPGLSDTPNVISNEEVNARFQGNSPEAYEPPAAKPIRASKPPDETVERVTGGGAEIPRAEDLGAFPELVNTEAKGMVNPTPEYRGIGPEPGSAAPVQMPKFAPNAPPGKTPMVPHNMFYNAKPPAGRTTAAPIRSTTAQAASPISDLGLSEEALQRLGQETEPAPGESAFDYFQARKQPNIPMTPEELEAYKLSRSQNPFSPSGYSSRGKR